MNTPYEINDSQTGNLKNQFTEVTKFSKVVAAIVFITLPFVGFYIGTRYGTETVVINQVSSQVIDTKVQESQYKKTHYGDGEIPLSWSTAHAADVSLVDTWPVKNYPLNQAFFSISADDIVFYGWNADQIDLYRLSSKAGKEYQNHVNEMAKGDSKISIEQRLINGSQSHVITWPLDNGEVTLAGSGGQDILISMGSSTESHYILIRKQALGDKAFEEAFSRYIDTFDISKF
jgi:hypothetical protein